MHLIQNRWWYTLIRADMYLIHLQTLIFTDMQWYESDTHTAATTIWNMCDMNVIQRDTHVILMMICDPKILSAWVSRVLYHSYQCVSLCIREVAIHCVDMERYMCDMMLIHIWYTMIHIDTHLIHCWYVCDTHLHLLAHPRGNDVPPKEQEKPPPLAMLSTWWGRSQERSTACSLGLCLPEDSSLCHCVPQYDRVWYSVIHCDTNVIPSGTGCVSNDCARVGSVLWRRISAALACISFGQSALQTHISVNLLVSSNIRHVSDDTYESRISHNIIPYHACISFGVSEFSITCITTYHVVSAVSEILYHRPVSRTPQLSHRDTADFVIQEREGAAGDMEQKPAILYQNISEHITKYHKERAAAPISWISRISHCIMMYQRRGITTYDIVWYSVIQCDTKLQTN